VTLLGLTGQPGAGKNTAADYLVEHHGFVQVAFADPIRQAALTLDPFVGTFYRLSEVVAMVGWDQAKVRYPESRRILQTLGTELGRDLHGPDVWVSMIFQKIDALAAGQPVVITDVRFRNEAEALWGRGGTLVRLRRQQDHRPEVLAHRSETESAALIADAEIFNETSRADLYRRLDLLLKTPTTRSPNG